jgi:hypothetical protein
MFSNKFMPLFDTDEGFGNTEQTEQTEQIEQTEQTESTEDGNAQPQATELPKLKINYLGEEKEIDLEEAKTLAQKGMNYEPLQQKWESSKTTLSKIEEIVRKAGFIDDNGHGDFDSWLEAANEQLMEREKQEMLESLNLNGQIPPELAEELYLSRKERAERQAEKERQAIEQKQQAQYKELLDFYKEVHGKDFDATTTLPKEVWQAVDKGIPPKYAYAEYLSRQAIKEQAIEKANTENGQASPGGVSGKAETPEKEFFTGEELDKLTPKQLDDPNIFEKAMRSLSRLGG